MPSTSERQRRFMGAELQRAKHGKRTRTGMSIEKLRHFAAKSVTTGSGISNEARRRALMLSKRKSRG